MSRRWWTILVLVTLLAGAAQAAGPKALVIGFDGMDPQLLQKFRNEGALPNFDRFVAGGGQVEPFGTSIPPQSPVAWSNFITGRDPGGHGIFDFIHRDPQTLLPYFSASEAKGPTRFWRLGKWKLPRGGVEVRNLRQGKAFWELLSDQGVDVTIFKVPSNFPPVECEARSLSGMGTPDLTGNYGISTLITDDPPVNRDLGGGRIVSVYLEQGNFVADLAGPTNTYREGDPAAQVDVIGRVDALSRAVWLTIGDTDVVVNEGEWSDWVTLDFELVPMPLIGRRGGGSLQSVRGICRFYLIEAAPNLRLYATPVQIDPVAPAMPISTPESYSREIAEDTGLFFTQGLPDDTSALENDFFDDEGYVQQSGLVLSERLAQLDSELERFAGLDSGFLFFYFNSPDQTCHMMWRNMDSGSPSHGTADARHAHRIRDVYRELDAALGLAMERAGDEATVMIMSDHGFAPWNRAFHLNTWLYENGYLVLQDGYKPTDVQMFNGVDWWRTQAYAIGINGLYINQVGREQQGSVEPGAAREELLVELKAALEATVDPLDGRRAIKSADRADQVYHGELKNSGPDIVVGYHRGWRGSNESALGRIMPTVFEDNMLKWSGDHCIAADEVPGVLLANRPIARANPSLVDMAPTILKLFGIDPPAEMVGGDLFEKR